MNKDESVIFATKLLEEMLSFFGINVAVSSTLEEEVMELSIPSTTLNSLIIGKDANNLRAFQNIISAALFLNQAKIYRVSIDVADYKKRHANKIIEQAEEWIKEVRESKQPKYLNLNPADRRTVHRLASEYSDIITHSEGEGRERQLIISLRED